MIDNVLFESFGGFVIDLDVTNTGEVDGVLYDAFMNWFVLGLGEISYTF